MQDFHFVMRMNTASVSLMKACATGEHIKDATLSARKAGKGQPEFLVDQDERRPDQLVPDGRIRGQRRRSDRSGVLQLREDRREYKPQKADGSLDAGIHFKYDLKAQKEG